MVRKGSTKRKRIENFERKPGREKPDEGREHITKYLQKVYNYVTKESDLFWGLKVQDIIPDNAKRVPSSKRTKVEKPKEPEVTADEDTPRPTVSEGYGEATLGSISRLLRALETLEEEDLRLSRNSTFVDIGSGYGKVVFHARLFSRVKKSFGIEYVQQRYDIAQRAREHFCFGHVIDQKPGETDKENHAGNGVPLVSDSSKGTEAELGALLDVDDVNFVCDDATNQAPFNYTHIYMYDCIFSEDTYEKLLPQLETSPFKILVSFRTLPFLTARGLTHIRPLGTIRISSTGRQCFTAHIYAKTQESPEDETTNNTTEQQDAQMQDEPVQVPPTQDTQMKEEPTQQQTSTQTLLSKEKETNETKQIPHNTYSPHDSQTSPISQPSQPASPQPPTPEPVQTEPTQEQENIEQQQLQEPQQINQEPQQMIQEPQEPQQLQQEPQPPQQELQQEPQPKQEEQEPQITPMAIEQQESHTPMPDTHESQILQTQESQEETQHQPHETQKSTSEPILTSSEPAVQQLSQETTNGPEITNTQDTKEITDASEPEITQNFDQQPTTEQPTEKHEQKEITSHISPSDIPQQPIIASSEITQQIEQHKQEQKDEVDVILMPEQPTETEEQAFHSPKLRARQIL